MGAANNCIFWIILAFCKGALMPFFPEVVENVTVKVGEDAELKCRVENLHNYKVAWVSVDSQTILSIHNSVITRNPRISLSRPSSNQWFLTIQRVQPSDRGWFMCQINTDPMVYRSGFLEVEVPPVILGNGDSGDIVAREGENHTLRCEARGHPKPLIVWRREDGEDIMVRGRKVSAVEHPILPLPKISRLQMGDYLCVASNGVMPSASKKIRVSVQFPPMFWIPSQLEGAFVGQDVTLECNSEAFPLSINYWTKKNGEMLISGDKYESISHANGYKVHMQLKIKNVGPEDFMDYICMAKNSLGGSDGKITLYEVTPPSTTTTTTTQLSSTTIKHVHKTETKRRGNWENWRKRRLRKKDRNKNERHKHHERTTPKIKSHFEEERITLTIENFEGGGTNPDNYNRNMASVAATSRLMVLAILTNVIVTCFEI